MKNKNSQKEFLFSPFYLKKSEKIILFFLIFLFCPFSSLAHNIKPSPGMKAPDFILESIDGKGVSLHDFTGEKVTILNFWAFWCDTWQDEADGFYSLKKNFPHIDYNILSVSIDGSPKLFLEKKEEFIYYPVLLDKDSFVSNLYGIENVPVIFILDKKGVIRYKFKGYAGTEELYKSIKKLSDERIENFSSKKEICLTFDDFPAGEDTKILLDILEKENVKATFFVIGEKAKDYPEILKRTVQDGHYTGIHCYSHNDFRNMPLENVKEEINKTYELIYEITGTEPLFFRPPGGHITSSIEDIALSMGLSPLLWTLNPYDYQRPGEQLLAERILGELKEDREIILLHDGVGDTREILPEIIRLCKDRGYEFVKLR